MTLGDSDDNLHVSENSSIDTNDYFIVTDYSSDDDGERQSYALRYKSSDALTDESPVIKFENPEQERPLKKFEHRNCSNNCRCCRSRWNKYFHFGSCRSCSAKAWWRNLRVYNLSNAKVDDFNIMVDTDGSGTVLSGGETFEAILW